MEDQSNPELELRDYLRVLRRRRFVLFGGAAMVVASALVASFLQIPLYEAKASVLLQPRSRESLFDPSTGQRNDPVRALQTEIQVLESDPVHAAVRRRLGSDDRIRATPVGQTDVIEVKATSTDPRRAAAVVNAHAKAYIDFRRKQAVSDLLAAGQEIQSKIGELETQIARATMEASGKAGPGTTLSPQRDALVQQQALFKQKLDQLQVDAALKTGGAQLVTPASVPTTPVRPKPVRNAVVALAVGLVFGVGLAFLFEYLDDSIKTKEDADLAAEGLPTLGLIPAVAGWKERDRAFLVSLAQPKSPAAEAYRTLRTSIQFLTLDRPLRTLQVTSPSATEGKSTTIANLAVALAQAGERVVVVCCDLRRPRIHHFFGLSNEVGFTSVLLGDVPLSSALQEVPGQDNLLLLASGPTPPNPSELLAGKRTVEVLTALQATAHIVLIDCPPVLPVTDAAVLSNRVDGTLVVATAGRTTRKQLQRTVEVLRQVNAPLVGTVLNGVTEDSGYGYSYRYHYTYYGGGHHAEQRTPTGQQEAPTNV